MGANAQMGVPWLGELRCHDSHVCSLSPALVKSRGVTRDVWFFSGSFAVFCFSPNLPRYVVRDSMHQGWPAGEGPAYVLLIPTLPTAELPTDNLCAPSPPMAHPHGKVNSAGNSHRVAQHRLLLRRIFTWSPTQPI